MPFSVRCSSTALFTILLLNFPISKQSITAAMSIFQLQFPHLLRLWIWRLNIMKFKYDLVARLQQIRLFLEQVHPWFLVQTVSDAKARDPLRTRKSSWRRRQGCGWRSLITQQECWRLQKQRGLRGEDLDQGHTGHIFQFESYSELRSVGTSRVSQTDVNEAPWSCSILKVVTDPTAHICTTVLTAVCKHAVCHLTMEMELQRQCCCLVETVCMPVSFQVHFVCKNSNRLTVENH